MGRLRGAAYPRSRKRLFVVALTPLVLGFEVPRQRCALAYVTLCDPPQSEPIVPGASALLQSLIALAQLAQATCTLGRSLGDVASQLGCLADVVQAIFATASVRVLPPLNPVSNPLFDGGGHLRLSDRDGPCRRKGPQQLFHLPSELRLLPIYKRQQLLQADLPTCPELAAKFAALAIELGASTLGDVRSDKLDLNVAVTNSSCSPPEFAQTPPDLLLHSPAIGDVTATGEQLQLCLDPPH